MRTRGLEVRSGNWWWSTETVEIRWDEVFGRVRTGRQPSRKLSTDSSTLAAVEVDRIHLQCSHADTRAQEAVEKYREHDQGEDHIQAIAFDGESYNGEGYSGDGSGNEE